MLKTKFGVIGEQLHDRLNGINDDEVAFANDSAQAKSIGNGTTTLVDVKNMQEMKTVVMFLCDEIATRLRKKCVVGSTFQISLRKNDLTWITKSHTIENSTNNSFDIFNTAINLIEKMWDKKTQIRSVRISVSNLCNENSINQLTLFEQKNTQKEKLDKAIDKIRDKYGYMSIKPLITQNKELLKSDALRLDDTDIDE